MNEIILFLGSGISYSSGIPSVSEITDDALTGSWHDRTDQNFARGKHPSKNIEKSNNVYKIQSVLKIIKNVSDHYYIERERPKSNYEDLFYICKQIVDNELREIDNPAIDPFIELINNKITELCDPIFNKPEIRIDLKLLAQRACDYLQCVVWNSIGYGVEPTGLDVISKISTNGLFDKTSIITLNHDLLIEKELNKSRINYADGFGQQNGDVKFFQPELFSQRTNTVSLLKLHGSINWCTFRIEKENGDVEDRYGLALKSDLDHCRDDNGRYYMNISARPLLLIGSYNKLMAYNFGIFRQLNNEFDKALSKSHTIIMSGYGWNDRGINGRLFEWLFEDRKNRILLLHENPEISIKDNSKSAMWHRYDDLVQQNQLIPIKRWMSDVTLESIKSILQ